VDRLTETAGSGMAESVEAEFSPGAWYGYWACSLYRRVEQLILIPNMVCITEVDQYKRCVVAGGGMWIA
jgi:hypothetical protein